MTTKADDTIRIQSTLREYADADFETASRELLNVMGYRSERAPAMSGDVADFITTFAAPTPDTKTERAFREHAQSVKVIFQVSDAEIAQSVQPDMFDAGEFDKGRAQSFVFVAVKLKGEEYPRGEYAQFVREINKRFPMPIVALFRAASGKVTLAFVNRRVSKRDAERDVLGNVSLIREIEPRKPHRAHLDILSELSLSERLKWMDSRDKQKNFDGLLEAWLDALDTEELNKRFYKELFGWFERATKQAKFPTTGAKVLPAEEHIIRLITRMLFVWFVKERGLSPPTCSTKRRSADCCETTTATRAIPTIVPSCKTCSSPRSIPRLTGVDSAAVPSARTAISPAIVIRAKSRTPTVCLNCSGRLPSSMEGCSTAWTPLTRPARVDTASTTSPTTPTRDADTPSPTACSLATTD